ncbi:hypothetical protein GUITHDRAFT_137702 [Guillardia theta CCMP2712]|uniref:Mitochondrial carrier protein n=1 Tax=Guillardia theta (strain CCMP2712) TaxID=905079 RepID=L1JG22_GUITC|nr:hypothetical protein GUITHDRAFT_137702 [Guillardia theta CCMP2712]EKX47094.1 hypothetical protein GUITHDRAFT_137702 [Guillardia theta CCMP2712]|eukprot:XP_005834074.1 hypothetical protein GUITHDRAFT_137702 [Guillardia theta CCMP2712]
MAGRGPLPFLRAPRTALCSVQLPSMKSIQHDVKHMFDFIPDGLRTPIVNAWAATLAGLAAYLVATPIEALKTGLQTWPGSTWVGVAQRIVERRGPAGFLYGLDAMWWAGVPYSIVMYSIYQPIKNRVNELLGGKQPMVGQTMGAAIAEIIGLTVFIPGELVRMRMMNNPGLYASFLQGLPDLTKNGFGGMYRGFKVTMIRDVPYTALQFVLFENIRQWCMRQSPDDVTSYALDDGGDGSVTFLESLGVGIVSAIFASTFTIPLDVLKSNIMTSSGSASLRKMSTTLIKNGGLSSMFKGFLPYTVINGAKWSSSMAVYSTTRDFYGLKSTGGAH